MCVKQRFHFHVLFFSLIQASKFQEKRAALAPASTLLRKYVTENLCFGPQCSGFGNYLFRTVTVIRTQAQVRIVRLYFRLKAYGFAK